MGPPSEAPPRFNLRLWGLTSLGIGLLSLIPILLLTSSGDDGREGAGQESGAQVAYVEFGRGADTLWLASAEHPEQRDRLLTVEHAPDYGIVASLAPDASRFVFTALPATTKAPSADAPAGLWLASLTDTARPEAITANVDLLVKPVWRPDGAGVVVRRSGRPAGELDQYRLVYVDLAAKTERDVAFANGLSLFPIAFRPASNELLVARLSTDASDLLILDVESGATREIGVLASGLTRDWSLSPAGDRLAYLELAMEAGQMRSRAYVIDLATGVRTAATDGDGDDFAPVWGADGALTIGRAGNDRGTSGLITVRSGESALAPAPAGFDVPLAASPTADGLAVRSFDGASARAPGRAVLALIRPDGSRTTIAGGEVTFLGWTNP
jgi:hypothetical protein